MNITSILGGGVIFIVGLLVLGACAKQPSADDKMLVQGEAVFQKTCKACHAQGVNGAPIVGNSRMWGKRVAQGEGVLVQHAIAGYNNAMPPRGGNPALSDDDIKAAVHYMVAQLKK